MIVSFENIAECTVPMADFRYVSAFDDDDDQLGKVPAEHLDQMKPLNEAASQFVWDFISDNKLHANVPFAEGFFGTIDKAKILPDNERDVKKWLYQRGLPFDKMVFLSWQPKVAMMVPWKMLIKYFPHFYSGGGGDLTIIDPSLTWAVLFYHEDEIYFGTKRDFVPSETFSDVDFIW